MSNKIVIDRQQAEKHLNYLGYQSGEAFLRFFYHSTDDRKKKDKGRKLSDLNWQQIEQYQTDGRGVYIVVNGAGGSGHSDTDIKQCCGIFCEWDDIPLAEQFEKWSELGFVEPTFTIFSGDKSMQPYWLFDKPISVEHWRELQVLLIELMEADESNKNPSRVFRLAGGWHIKPDREPIKSEIVSDSGIRYTYNDLRDRLLVLFRELESKRKLEIEQNQQNLLNLLPFSPKPSVKPDTTITIDTARIAGGVTTLIKSTEIPPPFGTKRLKYNEITVPVPISISLICALGKSKEYLKGVETLRNTSMAALARDLLGVQAEFMRLGQIASDDAYTLFLDACRGCPSGGGWDEREWQQIWNSAIKSNPLASISHYFSDGVESCVKGEYWRFLKAQQPSENLVLLPEAVPESDSEAVPDFEFVSESDSDSESRLNILNSDDKMIQDYRKISRKFGKRLRLNKLSKRIEIDGKPVSLDRARIQLALRHGILVRSSREDVQDILTEIALENQYSPIEEYLNSLPPAPDTSILDSIAERYFGVCDPIYEKFVRKTLIGAVARTFEPGCKIDTVLILQGKQGYKKSTFFKVLAGRKYFDDSLGTVSDKDERLKLHRAWFVEWSELESVFKRRDVSATKAFLSCGTDAIRPPYCRDTEDFDRPSIIVATTNKEEFLADETGNRRFWIIPVKKRIDTKLLRQERDAIWAAAVLAYRSGEEHYLDYENEETAEQLTEEFQTSDPWEDFIISYTENRDYLRLSDLLTHLQVDLSRQERSHQMRCSTILKKMGWEREFRIIGSKRVRVWEKVEKAELADQPQFMQSPSKTEVDQEVDHRIVSGFDQPDHSDHPFSQNLLISEQIVSATSELTPDSSTDSSTDPLAEPSDLITDSTLLANTESTCQPTEGKDFESWGEKDDQVDQVDQSQVQQGFENDQPLENEVDHSKTEVDQRVQQEREEAELLEYIRTVLQEGDPKLARNIQGVLTEVCGSGAADRKKVWASLSENEKAAFIVLLAAPESTATSESESETTAEPTTPELTPNPLEPTSITLEPTSVIPESISTSVEPTTPEPITPEPVTPEPITPEPTSAPLEATPTPESISASVEPKLAPLEPTSNSAPTSSQISSQDAVKLRNIALIWWPEYYPDQLQSLVSQMYGWDAPGTKYDVDVIAEWLQSQDELVRDRINQLISFKNNF